MIQQLYKKAYWCGYEDGVRDKVEALKGGLSVRVEGGQRILPVSYEEGGMGSDGWWVFIKDSEGDVSGNIVATWVEPPC